MKYVFIFISIFLFACSTAPQADQSEASTQAVKPPVETVKKAAPTVAPKAEAKPDEVGGSKAIKNSENVPSMTRKELQAKEADRKRCTTECITSRQMEAIDHRLIEQQCAEGCMKKHFVGQVGIKADSEKLKAPEGTQTGQPDSANGE